MYACLHAHHHISKHCFSFLSFFLSFEAYFTLPSTYILMCSKADIIANYLPTRKIVKASKKTTFFPEWDTHSLSHSHIHIHTHIHTYTYVHTYIHLHTRTYTYIPTHRKDFIHISPYIRSTRRMYIHNYQ